MPGPTRYSLVNYGAMVTCEPRMSAYAEALRKAVRPGCMVLDLGAGPGIFSLLACKFGAGKVVAVEPDASIELLRGLAADNGCAGTITVFEGMSTQFDPSEKADVIISDIRGCLPLFEGHIAAIVDARKRLLAKDGVLIPARDKLKIAVVESPENHAMTAEPWLRNDYHLDLTAGYAFACNSWWKVTLGADALLSSPVEFATLDYYSITDPDLASNAELTVARAGTAHGLLVWFDAELWPGVGFSNAPGEPPQIYGQAFLPLERAVDVAPGDRIAVEFTANLVDGGYVWGWNGVVHREGRSLAESSFRQSTFLSKIISPQSLRTRSSDYVAPASEAHEIDRLCLSLIDGVRTLAEIAGELRAAYPAKFSTSAEALNHVVELTNRYR